MPELSNLLRQRLGAETGTANAASLVHPGSLVHPDADTLTAYVERLLPSAERTSVVTHLSVCALCREVVALSLPQLPELEALQGQAAIPASRWRWLRTPGFQWAGAVAAVAVAAALVVELPRLQNDRRREFTQSQGAKPQAAQPEVARLDGARDAEQTKAVSASGQAASNVDRISTDRLAGIASVTRGASAPAASSLPPEVRKQQPALKDMQPSVAMVASADLAEKKETAGKQPAEEANLVFTAETVKRDYVNNDLFAHTNGASFKHDNLPQSPTPQPGISQLGLAAGAPVQLSSFQGIPANAKQKSKFHLNPLAPVEHLGCILCKVVDVGRLSLGSRPTPSSPAITTGAVTSSAMEVPKLSSSLLKDQPAQVASAAAKPASGELARSEGAFTRRAEAAPAGTRLRESAAAQMHWKVEGGRLLKSLDLDQWQDAYSRADTNFEFSAVTARGADVWAGGSQATLLHSRDGGAIWEPVKLASSASGTIVSIVANGLSVQVQTSTNQVWSSSDAGKTWILQNGSD